MAIKAILFDKDGTLVDFEATWLAVARKMAMRAANDDQPEADRLLALAGYDAERGAFKPDSVFAAGTNSELIALWYPDLSSDERRELVNDYNRFTAEEGASAAIALDGVIPALAELHGKGIKLGVATNDSTLGAEKTVLALGVAHMFVAAYGYDAVANPKPAPDALYAFADLNGLHPSEVAMVGDNRHDLEMARAGGAGLAVGVLSGNGSRKTLGSLADVLIASVADLPGYLQENP